jgi:hypothetical protein
MKRSHGIRMALASRKCNDCVSIGNFFRFKSD